MPTNFQAFVMAVAYRCLIRATTGYKKLTVGFYCATLGHQNWKQLPF
ncbi:MAG TPA: hypothetical protein V6C91_20020 [Coleofasciculaceae cyanobacterium]